MFPRIKLKMPNIKTYTLTQDILLMAGAEDHI